MLGRSVAPHGIAGLIADLSAEEADPRVRVTMLVDAWRCAMQVSRWRSGQGAYMQHRLGEASADDEDQHDVEASDATVAVENREDRLELVVHQGASGPPRAAPSSGYWRNVPNRPDAPGARSVGIDPDRRNARLDRRGLRYRWVRCRAHRPHGGGLRVRQELRETVKPAERRFCLAQQRRGLRAQHQGAPSPRRVEGPMFAASRRRRTSPNRWRSYRSRSTRSTQRL